MAATRKDGSRRSPRGQGAQLRTEAADAGLEMLVMGQNLTARAISDRVGRTSPALYKQFPNMDEVRLEVAKMAMIKIIAMRQNEAQTCQILANTFFQKVCPDLVHPEYAYTKQRIAYAHNLYVLDSYLLQIADTYREDSAEGIYRRLGLAGLAAEMILDRGAARKDEAGICIVPIDTDLPGQVTLPELARDLSLSYVNLQLSLLQ